MVSVPKKVIGHIHAMVHNEGKLTVFQYPEKLLVTCTHYTKQLTSIEEFQYRKKLLVTCTLSRRSKEVPSLSVSVPEKDIGHSYSLNTINNNQIWVSVPEKLLVTFTKT